MRASVIREGIIAGIIGATAVALWFLIIDVLAGQLFRTPLLLGEAALSVLGPGEESGAVKVLAYTIAHYAAFIAFGIIAAAIFRAADRQPAVLAGVLILFVAFELAFYGFTAMFAQGALGGIAWYQIGLANLIAAVLMGRYLVRGHPDAGHNLRVVLDGGE